MGGIVGYLDKSNVLYDLLNGVNPLKLGPKVQGLEDYTQYEVKQMVEDYVNEKLAEDFPGEDIYGSR